MLLVGHGLCVRVLVGPVLELGVQRTGQFFPFVSGLLSFHPIYSKKVGEQRGKNKITSTRGPLGHSFFAACDGVAGLGCGCRRLALPSQSWSQPACESWKALVVDEALLLRLRSQIGSKPCPQCLWMPLAELEPTQCVLGKRRTPLAALRSYGALEILLLTIAPTQERLAQGSASRGAGRETHRGHSAFRSPLCLSGLVLKWLVTMYFGDRSCSMEKEHTL